MLTYGAFAKVISAARDGNSVITALADTLDLSPTYVSDPSCKDALRGIFFGLFSPESPTVTLNEFANFINGWTGSPSQLEFVETYPLYMLDSAYAYVARESLFKPGQDEPTPEETAAFIHKYHALFEATKTPTTTTTTPGSAPPPIGGRKRTAALPTPIGTYLSSTRPGRDIILTAYMKQVDFRKVGARVGLG